MFREGNILPKVTAWSVTEPEFTPRFVGCPHSLCYIKCHTFKIKSNRIPRKTFNKQFVKLEHENYKTSAKEIMEQNKWKVFHVHELENLMLLGWKYSSN